MKSEKTARRLYEPLHGKGVMPCHIAKMLKEWEKLNPPKEGRRPFYPELGKFLDPNNPEGYCALAEKANAKSASEAEVGDASAVSVDNEAASAAAPQTPGA